MPSRLRVVGVSAVLVACLLTGCGRTAAERVQSYFGLRDVSSEEAIRAGLLEKVPLGTPEPEVVAFLKAGRIGKDDLSHVTWLGHDRIGCDVRLDPATWGFVKEEFWILFVLDDERKLVDIRVDMSLKGL